MWREYITVTKVEEVLDALEKYGLSRFLFPFHIASDNLEELGSCLNGLWELIMPGL